MKKPDKTQRDFWWFLLTGDLFVAPTIDGLEKRFGPSTAASVVVLVILAIAVVVAVTNLISWMLA